MINVLFTINCASKMKKNHRSLLKVIRLKSAIFRAGLIVYIPIHKPVLFGWIFSFTTQSYISGFMLIGKIGIFRTNFQTRFQVAVDGWFWWLTWRSSLVIYFVPFQLLLLGGSLWSDFIYWESFNTGWKGKY